MDNTFSTLAERVMRHDAELTLSAHLSGRDDPDHRWTVEVAGVDWTDDDQVTTQPMIQTFGRTLPGAAAAALAAMDGIVSATPSGMEPRHPAGDYLAALEWLAEVVSNSDIDPRIPVPPTTINARIFPQLLLTFWAEQHGADLPNFLRRMIDAIGKVDVNALVRVEYHRHVVDDIRAGVVIWNPDTDRIILAENATDEDRAAAENAQRRILGCLAKDWRGDLFDIIERRHAHRGHLRGL